MSASSRILQRFKECKEARVGYRGDLHLADYHGLTTRTAEMCIGFDGAQPVPTRQDIRQYIAREFDSKLSPIVSTARHHASHNAIVMVVEHVVPKRDVTESNNMAPIVAGELYQDTRTAEVWAVELEGEEKILIRQHEEDITAILEDRRSMVVGSIARLSKIERTAGREHLDQGDIVQFLRDGKTVRGVVDRLVRSAVGDTVVVNYNGEEVDVAAESVKVVSQNDADDKKKQFKYWEQVFGPEYAKDMVMGPAD